MKRKKKRKDGITYRGYLLQKSAHSGVNVISSSGYFVKWHPSEEEAKKAIDKFLNKHKIK